MVIQNSQVLFCSGNGHSTSYIGVTKKNRSYLGCHHIVSRNKKIKISTTIPILTNCGGDFDFFISRDNNCTVCDQALEHSSNNSDIFGPQQDMCGCRGGGCPLCW